MTVRDALNSALDEEMSADPKVFLMGEEVPVPTSISFIILQYLNYYYYYSSFCFYHFIAGWRISRCI
jgi:hypothetical protein